jgi:hypothetical protein
MKSVLRMVRGVVFLFSLTLVLMSCGCGLFSNQIPFAASGPIYEHSVTPLLTASNEEYSRVYTFNADGSATLKATNFHYPVEGLPEPVVEFEVTDTQLDALKQTLVDMKFLRLPEYIDTNTMDGVAYSYEVFMTNGSHCVSVENPDMKSLIHLNELVYEMAGDAPDRLQEAVREYQDPENAPKVPRLEQEVFSYKRHDPYNHEAGKPLYSPVIVMDENGYGYAYAENIQEKDYSVLAPYVEFQLSEQQLAELKKALMYITKSRSASSNRFNRKKTMCSM